MSVRSIGVYVKASLVAAGYLMLTSVVFAQITADLPQLTLNPVASGLVQPLHITNAGDGSARLFVVEQPGRIRTIRSGVLSASSFLDISARVSCCGERGLLSVAFPPGYAQKNYFYVDYTNLSGDTVISRFHVSSDPDLADPNTEEILLTISQPYPNHNGGQLAFGADGFLYIGMGDGGSGCDPNKYSQNLGDLPGNRKLLGKLLRIDVESGVKPYAVPSGNPLLNGSRSEIWAYGLRNPWRFSFDRVTGDLYIGDVGQNQFEEIDVQPAASQGGENHGWNIMEGFHCSNVSSCPGVPCNQTGLTLPVFEYNHQQGDCSITGGMVYRGPNYPRMYGLYFYSDYCSGRIWGLTRVGSLWQNNFLFSSGFNVTTFGDDEEGTLYLSDYGGGRILRIADTLAVMPVPQSRQTFSFPPAIVPDPQPDPSFAKPVGLGLFQGLGLLRLEIGLPQFSGPADIYFGVSAPSVDPRLFLLGPDGAFQPASAGLVAWKAGTSGPVNEALFGIVPTSSLPSGTYTLYLGVTPAGRTDAYYLWTTFFVIP